MSVIATIEQLEAIYGFPGEASTVKVARPRRPVAGFIRIHDERTLMMPDRRGNNRVDSLRNIVRDPRVALLFLIPGSGTTLRVNGRAHLSADSALLASFRMDGKAPRTVVVMTVGEIYFQCARAIVRSDLWNPDKRVDPKTLPPNAVVIVIALALLNPERELRPRRPRAATIP